MAGDLNTSILNRLAMLIMGKQVEVPDAEPQPIALTADREIMVSARIEESDSEAIETSNGTLLTSTLSVVYTNATSRKLPVVIEVCNSLNYSGATALVTYSLDGVLAEKVWLPSASQIPLGAGARFGPIHLLPGGTILASCSPSQTVTLTPVPGAKA